MQRRSFLIFTAVFCAVTLPAPATTRADSTTIIAAHDNTIFYSSQSNSLGAGQAIFVGNNGQNAPRRGLISFDIAGNIPAGATINNVQLKLFLNQVPGGVPPSPTISLYRLANDWGEGIAGNSTTGANGVGQGVAAGDGDATWNARHFSDAIPILWTTPGGDFAATSSASAAIIGATLNTPYTWGSTPALVADVQSFLNDPTNNLGWLLKANDETIAFSVRGFWSRESARTGQGSFSPQLLVTYTPVPEPTCAILMLISVILAKRQRP